MLAARRASKRREVWTKTGGLCWLCWRPVPLQKMTLDHVVPKAKGGSNAKANLMPAHRDCNQLRGDKAPPVLGEPLTTDERIALQARETP